MSQSSAQMQSQVGQEQRPTGQRVFPQGIMPVTPLSKLSLELRVKIYEELFYGSYEKGKTIRNPFPNERTYVDPSQARDIYPGRGSQILRTCKWIFDEAIAILYGRSKFIFDDWYADKGKKDAYLRVMSCGITSMYTWLQLIGPINRRRIQFLRLDIENPAYYFHDGEKKYTGEGRYQRKVPARMLSGRHLSNALRLLSQGHSLRNLELRVEQVKESVFPGPSMSHLFRPKEKSKLIAAFYELGGSVVFSLRSFSGIKIREESEWTDEAWKIYKDLKGHMAGDPIDANNSVGYQAATERHLELLKAINEAKALLATMNHDRSLGGGELSKALAGKIKDWEKEVRKVKIFLEINSLGGVPVVRGGR